MVGFLDCLIFRIVLFLASHPTYRSLLMIGPDPRVSRGDVSIPFAESSPRKRKGVCGAVIFYVAG